MSENSMREIKVFVGIGLDEDGIMDALNAQDNKGTSEELLHEVAHAILSAQQDDRAQIDKVDVVEVTINPDHPSQVSIEMEIEWSAYYGCRDMNTADRETEVETATYSSDGYLTFTVPLPRRAASNC